MNEKKRLSSGRWLILFLATALALALLVAGFNVATDPYGALGDPVTKWWTYDMTLNPRVSKLTYLEQHHEDYDSYIVGASGSSVLSVEKLNGYLDASFYNTFIYITEMKIFEDTALYLLDSYPMKNMILNLSIFSALVYYREPEKPTQYEYWKAGGTSPLSYYLNYLFLSPLEGIQKLEYKAGDGYLYDEYRDITPQTGEYDRSLRDVEPIRDLASYLRRSPYNRFVNYPEHHYKVPYLDECVGSVAAIKAKCEEKGVNLIVVCQPMYYEHLAYFKPKYQARFFNRLAEVTDYWDFTYSSLSFEPRYFYDLTHCRASIGEMELAKIFGDDSVYMPEDFGRYVKQGSKPGAPEAKPAAEADYTAQVPILHYPRLTQDEAADGEGISAAVFAEHMDALAAAGYTPIDVGQMRDYVERGGELPEKPILITLDGGSETDYELAWPILKERGFRATLFVSGSAMEQAGSLTAAQAAEMKAPGLITVASAGWDLPADGDSDARPGALMRQTGETEDEYVAFLTEDCRRMRELLGEDAGFFAFPGDQQDDRSRVVLSRAGTYASVCGEGGSAILIRGLPQCMLCMPRRTVTGDMTAEALLAELLQAED